MAEELTPQPPPDPQPEPALEPELPTYYVVESSSFAPCPAVSVIKGTDALVTHLKELVRSPEAADSWVAVFQGSRLFLAQGEPKYLLQPDQAPIPLFESTSPIPDESGFLGEAVVIKEDDKDDDLDDDDEDIDYDNIKDNQ